jgi:hypothetical protein
MSEIDKGMPTNPIEDIGEIGNIASDNYWLNQIKSQEDTARQIISISILILGISITSYSNNAKAFLLLMIPTNGSIFLQDDVIYGKFLTDYFGLFFFILFLFSFFFVWVIAIDTANYSLQLVHTDSYKTESFKKIADLKQGYISDTMKIVVLGIAWVSVAIYCFYIINFH